MRRLLWLALFAVALAASSVRADLPGPYPRPPRPLPPPPNPDIVPPVPNPNLEPLPPLPNPPVPDGVVPTPKPIPEGLKPAPVPQPTPQQGAVDPVTGRPYPPPAPRDPPKRTGLFHSCGSGMGAGLAGIGLAWGMLWLGNRFSGRVSRNAKK